MTTPGAAHKTKLSISSNRPYVITVWPSETSTSPETGDHSAAVNSLIVDLDARVTEHGGELMFLRSNCSDHSEGINLPNGTRTVTRNFSDEPGEEESISPQQWVLANADCILVDQTVALTIHGGQLPTELLKALSLGISILSISATNDKTASSSILWLGFSPASDVLDGRMDELTRAYPDGIVQMLKATAYPDGAEAITTRIKNFTEEKVPSILFRLEYPLLMLLTIGRKPRGHEILPRRALNKANSITGDIPPAFTNVRDMANHADALANVYAQKYRSSYIGRFFLSAIVSVAAALIILIIPTAKPVAFGIEFLATITIIGSYIAATKGGWQEKWLERRYLAENLRLITEIPQMAGEMLLRRQDFKTGAAEWSDIFIDRTARRVLLDAGTWPEVVFEKFIEGLKRSLADQIGYHQANVEKLATMERRLGMVGLLMFAFSMILATSSMVLVFVAPDFLEAASGLIVALLAFFPAFGAALFAIRIQANFKAEASRSKLVLDQLQSLTENMDDKEISSFHDVSLYAKRYLGIEKQDVSGWREIQAARPLDMP